MPMTLAALMVTQAETLRGLFRMLTATSCPYRYNFHLHTICSDGQLTPQQVAQQAMIHGLKGFAITDHHALEGYFQARTYVEAYPGTDRPQVYTGIEITAQLLGTEVHILGYGFDPYAPILHLYTMGTAPQGDLAQAERVIAALHEAGGLAILAHPARYRLPAEQLIPAAVARGIDGVETYYCYSNPDVWEPTPETTALVHALAVEHQLLETCGTDTHGQDILVRR